MSKNGYVEVTRVTEIEYIKIMIENEIIRMNRLIERMEAALRLEEDELKEWFKEAIENGMIKESL